MLEAVLFQAHMRFGMDVPLAAKLERAREVISLAGLYGKENQHVGGRLPGGIMVRGLSGGEKRRLSLCCGIVEGPEVLFCDEPTSGGCGGDGVDGRAIQLGGSHETLTHLDFQSLNTTVQTGLDSLAALKITQMLHRFAVDSGMVVVCTMYVRPSEFMFWWFVMHASMFTRLITHTSPRPHNPPSHQPRQSIWELFSQVMVLAKGRQLFVGSPADAHIWFTSGLGLTLPPGLPLAEFIIDATNIDFDKSFIYGEEDEEEAKDPEVEGRERKTLDSVEDLVQVCVHNWPFVQCAELQIQHTHAYKHTYTRHQAAAAFREQHPNVFLPLFFQQQSDSAAASPTTPTTIARRWIEGLRLWGFKFRVLLNRNCRIYTRNPGNVIGRFLIYAFVGVASGVFLFGIGRARGAHGAADMMGTLTVMKAPQRGTTPPLRWAGRIHTNPRHPDAPHHHRTHTGAIFFNLLGAVLFPYVSISLFLYDRQFYQGDNASGLYPPSAYFAANVLLEALFNTINGIAYSLIIYYMEDYPAFVQPTNPAWTLVGYLAIFVVINMATNAQVLFCSLVSPNVELAFILSAAYTTLALLLSGSMVSFPSINGSIGALQYLSSVKFGFAAVMLHFFDDNTRAVTPFGTVDALLHAMRVDSPDTAGENVLGCLAIYAAFMLGAFLCLKYLYKEKR